MAMLKSCNIWLEQRENKNYHDVLELLLLQPKQRNERAALALTGKSGMGQDEGLRALHSTAGTLATRAEREDKIVTIGQNNLCVSFEQIFGLKSARGKGPGGRVHP